MRTRTLFVLAALAACNLTSPAEPTFAQNTPSVARTPTPTPTPAPTPAPPPPEAPTPRAAPTLRDVRLTPRFDSPTSPDPLRGSFTLAQATQGMPAGSGLVAEIDTTMGAFTCNLLADRAPLTVANFIGLARGNRDFWDPMEGRWVKRPYYDGTVFHRVIPDFMIQGGDILRSGRGGPGYEFADENVQGHNRAGLLCMANRGPNTNGGQFFITEADRSHLDGSYSIFGECTPTDLVGRIARVPRNETDMPYEPVTIRRVTIRRR